MEMIKYFSNILKGTVLAIIPLIFAFGTVFADASYDINPSSGSLIQGCNYSFDIREYVSSGLSSNAGDIIITYNPSEIEILDSLPSLPGTQIQPGTVYEAYAGNIVNSSTGVIRLTGFSTSSQFTGNGLFARIAFRSQPTATSASFTISFTSFGNTYDSNIADTITSDDLLTSVTNATFTFGSGSCTADTTAPTIQFIYPTNYQVGVPENALITVRVSDAGSGVDLNNTDITINGVVYNASTPGVTVTGTPASYTFTIDPVDPIPQSYASSVLVRAEDITGNFRQSSIVFNVPPLPTPTPVIIEVCPEDTPTVTPSVLPTPTEIPDTQSPKIIHIEPIANGTHLPTAPIKIEISDDTSGVDINSVKLILNGEVYTTDMKENVTYSGNSNKYAITLIPKSPLPSNNYSTLTVTAQDIEGNGVSSSIVFNQGLIAPNIVPACIVTPTDNNSSFFKCLSGAISDINVIVRLEAPIRTGNLFTDMINGIKFAFNQLIKTIFSFGRIFPCFIRAILSNDNTWIYAILLVLVLVGWLISRINSFTIIGAYLQQIIYAVRKNNTEPLIIFQEGSRTISGIVTGFVNSNGSYKLTALSDSKGIVKGILKTGEYFVKIRSSKWIIKGNNLITIDSNRVPKVINLLRVHKGGIGRRIALAELVIAIVGIGITKYLLLTNPTGIDLVFMLLFTILFFDSIIRIRQRY